MLRYPGRSKTRRHSWCGPFALAVLSGLDYDTAYAKALRSINSNMGRKERATGRRPGYYRRLRAIQGMSVYHFGVAAKTLGLKIVWSKPTGSLTVLTFARQHTVKGRTYLLVAGCHYAVIKDGVFYDSWQQPIPVEQLTRYTRARITQVAEVRPRPAAILAAEGAAA